MRLRQTGAAHQTAAHLNLTQLVEEYEYSVNFQPEFPHRLSRIHVGLGWSTPAATLHNLTENVPGRHS